MPPVLQTPQQLRPQIADPECAAPAAVRQNDTHGRTLQLPCKQALQQQLRALIRAAGAAARRPRHIDGAPRLDHRQGQPRASGQLCAAADLCESRGEGVPLAAGCNSMARAP
jgi:hypothetical protein